MHHSFFRKRKLMIFLSAKLITSFGSLLSYFAVPLIVYSLYHSGFVLSIFELGSMVPSILLSVPLGLYLRNKNVKKVWFMSSFIAGLYLLFLSFQINIYTLFFLNFLLSVLSILVGISSQTIIVEIVGRDKLQWANTLMLSIIAINGILAPIVGSILLAISWQFVFLIDALTYFTEGILVCLLPVSGLYSAPRRKISAEVKTVIEYLRKNEKVKYSILTLFFTLLLVGGARILNVAYFNLFSSTYEYYGLAMSASALGMFIVLLIQNLKILKIKNSYRASTITLPFYSLFFFLIFISPSPLLSALSFLLLGFVNGIISPSLISAVQANTEREMLPQVMGLWKNLGSIAQLSSVMWIGFAVDVISPKILYLGIGLSLLVLFLFVGNVK